MSNPYESPEQVNEPESGPDDEREPGKGYGHKNAIAFLTILLAVPMGLVVIYLLAVLLLPHLMKWGFEAGR